MTVLNRVTIHDCVCACYFTVAVITTWIDLITITNLNAYTNSQQQKVITNTKAHMPHFVQEATSLMVHKQHFPSSPSGQLSSCPQ